jgi:hypothetical protein
MAVATQSPSPRLLGPWVRIPLDARLSVCLFCLSCLSCMQAETLWRADPLSKESYRLCIGLGNWKSIQTLANNNKINNNNKNNNITFSDRRIRNNVQKSVKSVLKGQCVHFDAMNEDNQESSRNNQCPNRDSKSVPPEYKLQALPLQSVRWLINSGTISFVIVQYVADVSAVSVIMVTAVRVNVPHK